MELNKPIGLYVHIPFCKRKCYYCDFPSFAKKKMKVREYISALKKEIKMLGNNREVDTVFIGGGTPSFIDSKYIESIVKCINRNFIVKKDAEISIEINPGTLDKAKIQKYIELGINRFSIGLQATQNTLLKDIGRIHTYEQFLDTYNTLRELKVDNINIDLIFGIPNQTLNNWKVSLDKIVKLKPEHISCYSLKIEEGTKFYSIKEKLQLPTEENEREMYKMAKSILKEAGYEHYEISNFSLPNYESKHNIKYWETEQYIGVGLSSHSFIDNVRYHNTSDLDEYINLVSKKDLSFQTIDSVNTEKDNISEFIFMGLRMIKGISKAKFQSKFGVKIEEQYENVLTKLIEKGLIMDSDGFILLTEKGLDLANIVMEEFV